MFSKNDDGHSHGCSVTEKGISNTIQAHRNITGKEGGEEQKQTFYLIRKGT